MQVELKILYHRIASVGYATAGSAAIDLRACTIIVDGDHSPLNTPYTLSPGEKIKIGTGIAIHVGSLVHSGMPMCSPEMSAAAILLPRSGAGWRGFELANTAGLIDADYTGELILAAKNGGSEPIVIESLERVAQAFIVPVFRPAFKTVYEFTAKTQRGAGGFGSTGSN